MTQRTKKRRVYKPRLVGDKVMAVIVNPADATNTETMLRDVEPAARALGWEIPSKLGGNN
jgi:hypothetical protein